MKTDHLARLLKLGCPPVAPTVVPPGFSAMQKIVRGSAPAPTRAPSPPVSARPSVTPPSPPSVRVVADLSPLEKMLAPLTAVAQAAPQPARSAPKLSIVDALALAQRTIASIKKSSAPKRPKTFDMAAEIQEELRVERERVAKAARPAPKPARVVKIQDVCVGFDIDANQVFKALDEGCILDPALDRAFFSSAGLKRERDVDLAAVMARESREEKEREEQAARLRTRRRVA